MKNELYAKIFKGIPIHIGELYLDQDTREIIAKEVALNISDNCDHEWKIISQVKIIDPHVCKKCGKIKSTN